MTMKPVIYVMLRNEKTTEDEGVSLRYRVNVADLVALGGLFVGGRRLDGV